MTRSAVVILCVFCVATLISQFLGLAFLWYRGQLTAETVRDIRTVLAGGDPNATGVVDEAETTQDSADDIMRARTGRVFDLERRQKELALLKTMVHERAESLVAAQNEFEQKKADFEERLNELTAAIDAESTEQARGILQSMPPADAVASLMAMDLQQNVALLRGMPEKKIAEILQQFLKAVDPNEIKRGQEIFKAISLGEPARTIVRETARQVAPDADPGPKQP